MAGAKQGGAETFFSDLVSALSKTDIEQKIVVRSESAITNILRTNGLDVIEFPFRGRFDFITKQKLLNEIREWNPHIVQTWMNRATYHCPLGNHVHVGWLGGYYDPKYFRKCDYVVGVTNKIVEFMRKTGKWSIDKSYYLPTFSRHLESEPLSREAFDTPADVPLIVALGRLHQKKAFDILLKALEKTPGAWLWIVGDGPIENELKKLSLDLGLDGRVRFLGWREDREALLSAADVVVMPSRYEPFGTVMIEAWAAKKPLIVAASAGPLGLVNDGEDALLVPVDDPISLADAIRKVISDENLAKSLADRGHAVWKDLFTEDAVVRKYIDFYEQILR